MKLWNNFDTNALCGADDALCNRLQRETRETLFLFSPIQKNQPLPETSRKKKAEATYTLLNFRNLENVFQRHLASEFLAWIIRALHFTLDFGDVCGFAKQPGCGGGAEVKGKSSVWADGDAGGDRDTLARGQSACLMGRETQYTSVMCAVLALNSCVKYNTIVSELGLLRKYMGGGCGTLQKSILFTPRDPNAGPTGGDGDAWPAPTINLTIWFEVRFLRAMFQGFEDVESAGTCVDCGFVRLWVADVSFSGYVSGVTTKG